MLTRRDVTVAAVASCLTLVAAVYAQTPAARLMPSTALDWNKFEVQKTPVGERRACFDQPTATLDRFECHVTTLSPGEAPHAPHQHPEEELIIVKEGTLAAMQQGRTTEVGPGSIIFEASGDLHGLRNVGKTPASYYVIKCWTAKTPAPPKP